MSEQQRLLNKYNNALKAGNSLEAEQTLNEMLELDSNSLVAHTGLGFLLANQDRYEEALSHLIQALDLSDSKPENLPLILSLLFKMGYCTEKLGLAEGAISIYSQIIDIEFTNIEALYLRSQLYLQLGELEKALADCKQVIYFPNEKNRLFKAYAHFTVMSSSTLAPTEDDIQWLLKDKELAKTEEEKIIFEFALANGYHKTKQYQLAFDTYQSANRQMRATLTYSQEKVEKKFALLMDFYSQYPEESLTGRRANKVPIFILGLPRSGTTLIESILAQAKHTLALGEVDYIDDIVRNISLSTGSYYPDCLAGLQDSQVSKIAKKYMEKADFECDIKGKTLIDKLPGNYQHIGLILAMNPNAKIVHCYKEPLDACFSLFKQVFKFGHKYCYSLEDIAHYYIHYRRLMEHWEKLYPGRIFHLSYEAFVEDPENLGRQLFEYCELDWNESYLDISGQSRSIKTASQQQVRGKINSKSVGRWKSYDINDNLTALKAALGEFL